MKLCKEVGIRAYGAFMVGNPTETIEDILATRSFIRESGMDDAAVSVTTPFPGTELWRWCQEHNLIPESIDWSKVTASEMSIPACQTIPVDEIVRLREEMIAEIVQRRPIKLSRILWRRLIHPIDTVIKLIRYPSKIPQTIRRLKI